ncbi:MAG TPA: methyltransferase domain-containing protein [Candidatus Saccharimonadales bacterium]|nr:methyltransferase domain-containing protein [Candidatus Saccharimonadales bacterium]
MTDFFVKLVVNLPIYPHWLEHKKLKQGNAVILKDISGRVLEVGAGDGSRKQHIIAEYPNVSEYIATDYSSWDDEFEGFSDIPNKFGNAGAIFMGRSHRHKLDKTCSATDLPFKNNSFDNHISFEVLEHIDDPEAFFKEAARVVKPKGKIILTVPFLYREHKMDFHRYTPDYFKYIAKKNGLEIKNFYHNTGFGTTQASLANQWFVRKVLESPIFLRPVYLLASPFAFVLNNVLGYLIDLNPDRRFATRFHIVLEKA